MFLQDTWRVAMDAVAPTAALVCEGFDHVAVRSFLHLVLALLFTHQTFH